jgi:hypothetical protein
MAPMLFIVPWHTTTNVDPSGQERKEEEKKKGKKERAKSHCTVHRRFGQKSRLPQLVRSKNLPWSENFSSQTLIHSVVLSPQAPRQDFG